MDVILTTEHPVAQCVDLRAMLGDRFRCEFEESYYAELPEYRSVEACWLTIIPCRYGHISPQGERTLAAYSGSRLKRLELAALDCVELYVEGDHELTVIFDVADFDRVAAVMEPRRRRRLSPEQRAACAERLKAYHFQPGVTARQAPSGALGTCQTGETGSEAVPAIPTSICT